MRLLKNICYLIICFFLYRYPAGYPNSHYISPSGGGSGGGGGSYYPSGVGGDFPSGYRERYPPGSGGGGGGAPMDWGPGGRGGERPDYGDYRRSGEYDRRPPPANS